MIKGKNIKLLSYSRVDEHDLPKIKYQYDISLNIPFFTALEGKEKIMSRFNKDNVKLISMSHATLNNYSEVKQLTVYGTELTEHILIEITSIWIDPHFLCFTLWHKDDDTRKKYLVDVLFNEDVISDDCKKNTGMKFGEICIAPCTIRIQTVEADPKTFIPQPARLKKLTNNAKKALSVKFWDAFNKRDYEHAAIYIKRLFPLYKRDKSQLIFLRTVQALCYFLGKKNEKAIDQFIQSGIDFHTIGHDRFCDLCFFFAIDAAKEIEDLNFVCASMKKIAQKIPSLSLNEREEVSQILLNYAVSVNTGVVVLCRRALEIRLKQILIKKFRTSINNLITECHTAGVLKQRKIKHPTLQPILLIARFKKILTPKEFRLASKIKNVGNRIHRVKRVKYDEEARYAIQACIHILRRLKSK